MGEKPSGIKFDNEPEANDYIIRHKEKMTQAEIDAYLASFARLEQELRKNHYQEKGSIDIRKDNGRVIFGYRKVYPHLHITSNHGEYVLAPREGENVLDEETTSRLCPRDYPFKKSWSYLIEILDLAMTITDEPQHETQKFRLRNQGTRSLKVYFNPETKLVLDSPDFPSFIYYSGLDEVTVTIQNGGKANEWWIVSHDDISEFKDYIIITKDPQKFNKDMQTITTAPYGYKLLKL